MNVWDINLSETAKGLPAEAVSVATRVFTAILLAIKNLSLYPQGHSICVNSIKQLHTRLDAYLQQYGYLRLEIERSRIVSQGEEIYSCLPEEGTLPFTLFRDGIRWLEFTKGIDPEEITKFLMIVNQYTILLAEPEGDIVTTIWESQFPHIQYDVADFFVGSEGEMKDRVSDFKASCTASVLREVNLNDQTYPSDPPIDPALLILTSQEQEQLLEMIHFEEEIDISSYVNVLLDSLLLHRDEESFSTIMDVLLQEFNNSLAQSEFEVTLKIVRGLRRILENNREQLPWAGPIIECFFLTVSGIESLSPVVKAWNDISTEQINILKQIFRNLHPQANYSLVPLLLTNQPHQHRQLLIDSIVTLAAEDMHPLELLLNHSDEKILENLIPLFAGMEGEPSLKCLMKLTHHRSSSIRQKAMRAIMHNRLIPVREMFDFIDDPDEAVRRLVLKQLGQFRDSAVEMLFLTYLKNKKFNNNQTGHVIECFRALGRCGSSYSVPYLRETLFHRKWMPTFWRSAYRKGAAAALGALKIPEADQMLEEARRSLYPSLRSLFREADQKFPKKREAGNRV